MSLQIQLEDGEELIFQDRFGHEKRPMVLAVSDRSLYFTKEKHFSTESFYIHRVPISEVNEVSLLPLSPVTRWVVALAVFFGGFVLEAGILWNVYRQLPGTRVSPWPIAFMLIGVAMMFFGRKRKVLTVKFGNDRFRWKPGFLDDNAKTTNLQQGFVDACRNLRLKIIDNADSIK